MSDEKKPRQMPKGGRKGGAVFPRIALSDAVSYGRKLVSKTHTGPQPQDVIFSGVVGAKSGTGNVRVSALKQYGLLVGDTTKGYEAAELAKKIASAPSDELQPLLRTAALRPNIFRRMFDTYHGDTVNKAKLRQRAADLEVHPDETANCVDLYISSVLTAKLASIENDSVIHIPKSQLATAAGPTTSDPADSELGNEGRSPESIEELDSEVQAEEDADMPLGKTRNTTPRVVFNVNINLDSSLDTEKRQKQLELLKRFGAI